MSITLRHGGPAITVARAAQPSGTPVASPQHQASAPNGHTLHYRRRQSDKNGRRSARLSQPSPPSTQPYRTGRSAAAICPDQGAETSSPAECRAFPSRMFMRTIAQWVRRWVEAFGSRTPIRERRRRRRPPANGGSSCCTLTAEGPCASEHAPAGYRRRSEVNPASTGSTGSAVRAPSPTSSRSASGPRPAGRGWSSTTSPPKR